MFLFLSSWASFAQFKTVSGTVTDASNLPIPGVNVGSAEQNSTSITDFDGKFTIGIKSDQDVLTFTFIGFKSQQIKVGDSETINVSLVENSMALDEVVVVGYGSMKKSDLTGAVSSIKGNDLLKVASNRPIEALQGRVAGMNITKTSGQPGAGVKVRIRGVGSTNNSDPLYVVDGVPVGIDIEFLAPEDIESVEILKDASSTAIYGNKGANGVIIVTTKSGKSSTKPIFSYNAYTAVSEIPKKINLLNAKELGGLIIEAAGNDNQTLPTSLQERINYVLTNNVKETDWQNEVFKRGHVNNHNLSVRGGITANNDPNQEINYSLSGTSFNEDGTVKNTEFKKYLFNSKTEYKINDKFNIGIQMDLFSSESGNNLPEGINGGLIPLALTSNPMDSPTDINGNFIALPSAFGQNPSLVVDQLKYGKNRVNSYGFRSWMQFKIANGLDFKTNFKVSNGATHNKNYSPAYYLNENFNQALSQLYESRGELYNWTWINLLNYTKTFNSVHKLIATLGREQSYSKSSGFSGIGVDVPADSDLQYLNLSKTFNERMNSYQSQSGTDSYFARAFYSFNNKYMFTGTARYDGSSKFSGDNKWGFFPSLGVSWKADEEKFIKDLKTFSTLKFRAGWGQVGNESSAQAGSDLANIGNYSMQYVFNNTQYQGGTTTNIPTPDLRWEVVETQNYGVDMSFLNNDLKFTADYFIKNTNDMITRVALPGYYPKDRPNANIGKMNNKGIELTASYENKIGSVNFNVGANITFIKNKIVKLNSTNSAYIDGGYIDKLGYTTRTEADREIAYFYGYQTNGIFRTIDELLEFTKLQPNAQLGDVRFTDKNGDGALDESDRTYLGSGQGDFSYGFNFSADYKGFDFSANFYGVQGNEIVNGMGLKLLDVNDYYNAYADRLDRFHPINNPNGTGPRVTLSDANNNLRFSDRYVEDGSFLRLKNIQFGYTIPKKYLQKTKIDKLRFYASSQNLLTFTKYKGYDPEIGDLTQSAASDIRSLGIGVDLGNYPQPRMYSFGVNVNF